MKEKTKGTKLITGEKGKVKFICPYCNEVFYFTKEAIAKELVKKKEKDLKKGFSEDWLLAFIETEKQKSYKEGVVDGMKGRVFEKITIDTEAKFKDLENLISNEKKKDKII